MELLCCENESDCVISQEDPVFIEDDRVLARLLESEDRYSVTCNYFRFVQKEITSGMRKICVSWMMEVCEEEKCEDPVFPMSVYYLDRFLSMVNIRKEYLQLVACSCLMMASKVRQSTPLSSRTLASYTDYAYEHTDITQWELLVLCRLRWDVAAVIPNDFLDLILARLQLGECKSIVRKHAIIFLQLCTSEFKFTSWSASLRALGCICAAINGLNQVRDQWNSQNLPRFLQELTGIEVSIIDLCMQQVEEEIATHVLQVLEKTVAEQRPFTINGSGSCPATKDDLYPDNECMEQTPETPTDVQDVLA